MVAGRAKELAAIALWLAPLLAACGQQGTAPDESAKPQAAMTRQVPAASDGAASPTAAMARPVDFGDDASKYARDGECDDKRFAGPGMTDTPLLESDVSHDATDCRAAFNQQRLTLAAAAPASPASYAAGGVDHIIWGDDASKYARDGECDDRRFAGPGMTATPLLDSDVKHDASDCRTAYAQGRLTLSQ